MTHADETERKVMDGLFGAQLRGGPLAGVLVVELTTTLAGEFAGGLLADMGATVIKVEPRAGAPLRRQGPALPAEDSLYFQAENRGKLSICAELEDFAQQAWLMRLLAVADALVEDLGPGIIEAAALSPDALWQRNRALCLLRISPFGQNGPLAGARGDDRIAQAFSGLQYTTGFIDRPPLPVAVPLADCWTGVHGANGLLLALLHVRHGGLGQVVDLGLYETVLRLEEGMIVRFDRNGTVAERAGNQNPGVSPANIYPTRDGGWIALSGAGDAPFKRLCEAIGRPEAASDPRFSTTAARLQHREEADELVGAWIAHHDLLAVEERFVAVGVAGSAVRSSAQIASEAHVTARAALMRLCTSEGRSFLAPAPVPRFSAAVAQRPERAPLVGEHTELVRAAVEALPAAAEPPRATDAEPTAALAGIRVLDLSQALAGPVAATILAEFGADVVMVELPETAARGPRPSDAGLSFIVTNRNKRSITLDVRSDEGRAAFLQLLPDYDVVVENFRPGTLERWSLGPDVLLRHNPRLVLLRASGFGQTGPYAGRTTYNPVGLVFGGMTYLGGWADRAPLRDGIMAGDYSTALFGLLGALAALFARERSGAGQVVDVAMYEAVLRMTGDTLPLWSALGERRERAGGAWPLYPPLLTAAAADGRYVAVSVEVSAALGSALARLDASSAAGAEAAVEALTGFIAKRPAAEAVASLRGAGLAASAVNSVADLLTEPHLWSRGNLIRASDPRLGEITVQGVVPHLSRTPGNVTGWSSHAGSDNEAVFGARADATA